MNIFMVEDKIKRLENYIKEGIVNKKEEKEKLKEKVRKWKKKKR